jgi:hypothetical protein
MIPNNIHYVIPGPYVKRLHVLLRARHQPFREEDGEEPARVVQASRRHPRQARNQDHAPREENKGPAVKPIKLYEGKLCAGIKST